MSSVVTCETKHSYNNQDINHAIEYLKGYTGMPMREVLFFSSPWISVKENAFNEEINLSTSNQSNERYVASISIVENTKDVIVKAIQSMFASVVIFPDFEDSTDIQSAFFDLHDQATRDNTFLIVFSKDYRNQDDMFTYALNLPLIDTPN